MVDCDHEGALCCDGCGGGELLLWCGVHLLFSMDSTWRRSCDLCGGGGAVGGGDDGCGGFFL